MADINPHDQKFADAFTSILADDAGPEPKKKKRKTASGPATAKGQVRCLAPSAHSSLDLTRLSVLHAQGPILSRVDTSKEDREEALEKKRLRNERKAKQVKRMLRAKDRVSTNRLASSGRRPLLPDDSRSRLLLSGDRRRTWTSGSGACRRSLRRVS